MLTNACEIFYLYLKKETKVSGLLDFFGFLFKNESVNA